MGRQFTGGRQGQQTSLRFKEDEVWIPDAFPRDRKRRHRRGGKKKRKNDVAIVRV